MTGRNILVIPHTPHTHVRVRSFEMARYLARKNNVHYLLWDEVNDFSLLGRIKQRVKSFLTRSEQSTAELGRHENVDGVTVLKDVPKAYSPERYANWRNAGTISRIINEHNIDLVINSAFSLSPVPKSEAIEYVYDLVDDPFTDGSAGANNVRRRFIDGEISKSDLVTACSVTLAEYVSVRWARNALFVPNGTEIEAMWGVSTIEVTRLRRHLGIENRKVVGFVSNFEPWNGLDFLADVFETISRRRKDICLVLVGSGRGLDNIRNRLDGMGNVVIAGKVPPSEVSAYFRMIDLGVLPFEQSDLTNRAFPIKIVEYGAARKHVVAVPLDELVHHRFPNVYLAERHVGIWADAICESIDLSWKAEWDAVYSEYDWSRIIDERLAPHLCALEMTGSRKHEVKNTGRLGANALVSR